MVTHDHDFHWERCQPYASRHPEINQYVDDNFILVLPHLKQAVINTFSLETFKNRFYIAGRSMQYVVDFIRIYDVTTPEN